MSDPAGYGYKKSVTCQATNNAEVNFCQRVLIPYESKFQSDFRDILFTEDDGSTILQHSITFKEDSKQAIAWVQVPSKPAAGKAIRLYFGNPSATDSSDDSIFEYSDRFNDLTGWTTEGDVSIISNQMVLSTDGVLDAKTYDSANIERGDVFGIVAKIEGGTASRPQRRLGGAEGEPDPGEYRNIYFKGSGIISWSTGLAGSDTASDVAEDWHEFDYHIKNATDSKYYLNAVLNGSIDGGSNAVAQNFGFAMRLASGQACDIIVDMVFVLPGPSDGEDIVNATLGPTESTTIGKKYIEKIVDAVGNILKNDLDSFIDEINAENTDFNIDYVLNSNVYYGRYFLLDKLPSIIIWPDVAGVSPGIAGLDYNTHEIAPQYQIVVYVFVNDDDQIRLHKRVWRYIDAIIRTLKQDSTLNGEVDRFIYSGITYIDPFATNESNYYLESNGVRFLVDETENVRT